ncbi:hypothetical protein LX16_2376 [Stackebrandtia albiflava]|uniref:Uncharacterized protein n=1 Tax=Stackebrandtia albiflava TaxID=406432 RepID=A0A562V165_9ACTN|nr:hypothetical protein [Stackebrandtia albiflava]TWJ11649.1 hypothetical protein LX16_2376 [Stackebrandtia albiflava]
MSADEYLAALRELDVLRGSQQDAAAADAGRRGLLHRDMGALWERLGAQRTALNALAATAVLPPVPDKPYPVARPADPVAEVALATADADAADEGLEQARYLAHRPALLPRWRADERNGLIYGVAGLLSLLAQMTVLAGAAGQPFSEQFAEFAVCLVLPFVAFGAAWLAIGVVSRPRLGGEEARPAHKLVRNPRLGLVVCLSTWVVSWWLGTVYLG